MKKHTRVFQTSFSLTQVQHSMTKKVLDQNKLYKLPEFNNMVMTGKEIEDLIESAYNELMLSKRRIKK